MWNPEYHWSYRHADELGLSVGNSWKSMQFASECSYAALCANSC